MKNYKETVANLNADLEQSKSELKNYHFNILSKLIEEKAKGYKLNSKINKLAYQRTGQKSYDIIDWAQITNYGQVTLAVDGEKRTWIIKNKETLQNYPSRQAAVKRYLYLLKIHTK